MEIPPEEEQGRVQSQHRASRARRPVFQLSGHRRRHRCRGTRHLPDGYGARSASSQHLRVCPALVLHPPRGRASPQPPSRRLRTVLMLPLNGNPNPGNVGSDFARFDMDFWSAVKALDARNQRRQDALQDLNEWRNAIAHQDWAAAPPCASAPSGSGARRVGPWRDPSTAPSESTSRRWWEASLRDGVRLLVSSA